MSDDCAICLECIDENIDNNIKTTKCNHTFHSNCFETWIKINNSCPLCRTVFIAIPIIDDTAIPLQFWFNRDTRLSIPLVSIPSHRPGPPAIYNYSFGLYPESSEPSSTVNLSRIQPQIRIQPQMI
jgi:hypothetical protein